MLAGLLNAAAATPEVLLRFVSVENVAFIGGLPRLVLLGKKPLSARAELCFQQDERTLSEIKFETAGLNGAIELVGAQIDAPSRLNCSSRLPGCP